MFYFNSASEISIWKKKLKKCETVSKSQKENHTDTDTHIYY